MRTTLRALLVPLALGCSHMQVTDDMLYKPVAGDPSQAHNIEVAATDGTPLRGRLIEKPGSQRAILVFYGSGQSVVEVASKLALLADRYNADVLCLDYRGSGFTPATFPAQVPRLHTLRDDGLAAFDFLRKREGKKEIDLVGFSLGTMVATHVAANRPVGAAVLFAPVPSVRDLAEALVAGMSGWKRNWTKIDMDPALEDHPQPIEEAVVIRARLLVIHGTEDVTIPYPLGKKLADAAVSSDGKMFCPVKGAGHDDLALDRPEVAECLDTFFGRTP